jgi:hypothetical protein
MINFIQKIDLAIFLTYETYVMDATLKFNYLSLLMIILTHWHISTSMHVGYWQLIAEIVYVLVKKYSMAL